MQYPALIASNSALSLQEMASVCLAEALAVGRAVCANAWEWCETTHTTVISGERRILFCRFRCVARKSHLRPPATPTALVTYGSATSDRGLMVMPAVPPGQWEPLVGACGAIE